MNSFDSEKPTKTFRSFQLYFCVAFQGFVLEVRLLFSYLRSFRYQLFSFFFY